jgi:hypothetical protein
MAQRADFVSGTETPPSAVEHLPRLFPFSLGIPDGKKSLIVPQLPV